MIFSKNLVGGLTVAYVALVGCDHHRNLRIKSKFSGDRMVKRLGHKTGWNWINRVEWGGAPFNNQSIQRFTKRNTSMISPKTKHNFFCQSKIQKNKSSSKFYTVFCRETTFVANLRTLKWRISKPLGCSKNGKCEICAHLTESPWNCNLFSQELEEHKTLQKDNASKLSEYQYQ